MEEYAPTWMVGSGPVGRVQVTLRRFETTFMEPLPAGGELISLPRVGDLHPRYAWRAAA
jgi:hypothetical protein